MTTQYTPNFQLAMPDFRAGPWHDLVNNDFARIDALLYSSMSQGNVSPWTNATAYTPGITVIDNSDASVWVCAVGHTSATLPTTFLADRTAHPTYWARLLTGFAPRGEWAQNTQYFPYDLTYDSARGIMALCQTIHISTATGSILDDSSHWAFLLNMTDVGTVIASAVTYSNTASGLTATNVQNALDQIQTEVVSLNNVNVTQGSQITNLTSVNSTQTSDIASLTTRMTAVENKNTTQDAAIASIPISVPSGSNMLFYNATAPTGWTKLTGANDFALRVVSGAGGGSGGLYGFSGVFASQVTGSHTLTIAEIPSHTHNITTDYALTGDEYVIFQPVNADLATRGSQATQPAGGGAAHNHPIDLRVKYLDVIVASKN